MSSVLHYFLYLLFRLFLTQCSLFFFFSFFARLSDDSFLVASPGEDSQLVCGEGEKTLSQEQLSHNRNKMTRTFAALLNVSLKMTVLCIIKKELQNPTSTFHPLEEMCQENGSCTQLEYNGNGSFAFWRQELIAEHHLCGHERKEQTRAERGTGKCCFPEDSVLVKYWISCTSHRIA